MKSRSFDNIFLVQDKCYLPSRIFIGSGTCMLLNKKNTLKRSKVHSEWDEHWQAWEWHISSGGHSTQRSNVTLFYCPTWRISYPFIAGSAGVAFDRNQTLESSEFHLGILIWRPLVTISVCHTEYFSWHYFKVFHIYPTTHKKEHNQEIIQNLWMRTLKERYY